MRIQPFRSLRIICSQNFSQHAHAPPLKTPLAPSPPCFNHWIIFESLLLELPRANLPTPIALDRLLSNLHSLPSSIRKTSTTKKTPWPRGGPPCSARARPGRASQSTEDRLHHEICQAVSRSRLFRNPRCPQAPQHRTPSKVRKPTFPQGISVCVGILEKSAQRNLFSLRR